MTRLKAREPEGQVELDGNLASQQKVLTRAQEKNLEVKMETG